MQKLWSQIENISQTTLAHYNSRRSSVSLGMSAANAVFGLDYRLSDCLTRFTENTLSGLPTGVSRKQQN